MNPYDFDLTEASRIYAVANTPLFLVRKLQADPAVKAICDACAGQQIVEALRATIMVEPANSVEAVRPYAFLVALWFKPEVEHLQAAATFQTSIYNWYQYVAQVLVETFSPVQRQVIEVPGIVRTQSASAGSSTPTTGVIIFA